MGVVVQKYGGTSVGSIERIQAVATRVQRARQEGHQVVVVVSAMAGETDRLLRLAGEVSATPLAREVDTLLAKMKSIPGLADADTTLRSGKPEVRLEIDRPRAADLGVSVLDIEQAINTLVAGQVASTFPTVARPTSTPVFTHRTCRSCCGPMTTTIRSLSCSTSTTSQAGMADGCVRFCSPGC